MNAYNDFIKYYFYEPYNANSNYLERQYKLNSFLLKNKNITLNSLLKNIIEKKESKEGEDKLKFLLELGIDKNPDILILAKNNNKFIYEKILLDNGFPFNIKIIEGFTGIEELDKKIILDMDLDDINLVYLTKNKRLQNIIEKNIIEILKLNTPKITEDELIQTYNETKIHPKTSFDIIVDFAVKLLIDNNVKLFKKILAIDFEKQRFIYSNYDRNRFDNFWDYIAFKVIDDNVLLEKVFMVVSNNYEWEEFIDLIHENYIDESFDIKTVTFINNLLKIAEKTNQMYILDFLLKFYFVIDNPSKKILLLIDDMFKTQREDIIKRGEDDELHYFDMNVKFYKQTQKKLTTKEINKFLFELLKDSKYDEFEMYRKYYSGKKGINIDYKSFIPSGKINEFLFNLLETENYMELEKYMEYYAREGVDIDYKRFISGGGTFGRPRVDMEIRKIQNKYSKKK